ncbi:hypothetical protein [Ottowia sp.]|uniref:hypothetical protein n=1 Tax=Ottowia sp. TaxID=1898956 RepID=UPI002B838DF6|nr:hypothetical protein [Ottowia sp.]
MDDFNDDSPPHPKRLAFHWLFKRFFCVLCDSSAPSAFGGLVVLARPFDTMVVIAARGSFIGATPSFDSNLQPG